MKLPKNFTTVTPFSKYLAMALFILFPFVGFYLGIQYAKLTAKPPIISFAECKNAGYPVLFSYPAQCRTPDGRIFREILPSSLPIIQVTISPTP